ncbi:hypothetical protein PDJAM_G00174520 [Pangasius djambal]|uniref:Uncharacterized protein n=1 Tax=Pangasius djambal TaxID=1691987 RepID=A0ACC5ZNA1_9TELE|nr:hypothetical protein [Pangasius djambal]
MVQCFVAECDHSYSKNQCSFFRLPSNIRTRRKWEQLCGRPPDCSNENSRICSCHFVGGTKSAAPSVFKWREEKLSCFTASHTDLKEEPEEKDIMSSAPGSAASLSRAGGEEMITRFKQEETETEISRFQTTPAGNQRRSDQNVSETENKILETQNLTSLERILPPDYTHHLCSYTSSGDDSQFGVVFRCQFRLALKSEAELLQWLSRFQEQSGLTWRKSKTYPAVGPVTKFRVDLRCHHNTRAKIESSRRTRNTGCPATVYLVVKNTTYSRGRESRSGDSHLREGLSAVITLRHEHNHRVAATDPLCWSDVSAATAEKLKTLFQNGHSPSSALETLKYDLQEENGDDSPDLSACPDVHYCHKLYFEIFQKAYQAPSWEEILHDIRQQIEKYNSEQGEDSLAVDTTEDGQVVVAVCTPLMKSVHTRIAESGDVLLINSFWSCDDKNLKIFVLLCHSAERGLPLGVIITSEETQSTISAGLQLLKTLIPRRNFFGCHGGPRTIALSEDCTPLRQALKEAYPEASFLLCAFHLMQEMRQWLRDNSNKITKPERSQLLDLFRRMISARCEDFLQSHYDAIRSNPLAAKHPEFVQRLEETYERRETWAACFQDDLPSSYAGFAKRILKDKVLHQLKAFNLIQMVHFVQTRMEAHYIHQLTLGVNNGNLCQQSEAYISEVTRSNIVQQDEENYIVVGETSDIQHRVNITLRTCTCPVGVATGSCEHLNAVRAQRLQEVFYEITNNTDSTIKQELKKHDISNADVGRDAAVVMDTEQAQASQTPAGTTSCLVEELMQVFDSIRDKVLNDPHTFTIPVQRFVSHYKNIKSDADLASALSVFGTRNCRRTSFRKAAAGEHGTLNSGRLLKRIKKEHSYPSWTRKRAMSQSLEFCMDHNTSDENKT